MSPVKSPQELSAAGIGKKDKLVVEKAEEEELPPGWKLEVKTRKGVNGRKKDRYYTDPVTGYVFRSLTDVLRYLKTGKLGRLAKKPKSTETDAQAVEVSESKEQMVASSPLSETLSNKRPLDDGSVTRVKSSETSKSELPQRASKRLAGVNIDAPPPAAPPPSSPKPKSQKATRLSGIKVDAPPPAEPKEPKTRQAKRQAGTEIETPLTTPPEPKTRKATRQVGIRVEPPPEPKTSRQGTARQAGEAQTRPTEPTDVLAISKEKDKKTETQKMTANDGNADMAAKSRVTQKSLEKINEDKSKADEKRESHTVLPPATPATIPPVGYPIPEKHPPPAFVPPMESGISMAGSHHKKQDLPVTKPTQESSINFCLNDFWTDPCIEFAVKTLTGAIPFGDLNKADNFPASPVEVPMEELWTDPCIEFAVKTLTGAIPVGKDPGIQDYLHHQPTASTSNKVMNFSQTEVLPRHFEIGHNKQGHNKQGDSFGNGGLQKSGNIGFHQVNANNGQCSRPRFFQ